MPRRYSLFIFSFILLVASGCAQESNSDSTLKPTDGQQVDDGTESEMRQVNIQLFYADDQLLELQETTDEITIENDADKYEKTYLALTTSSNQNFVTLWEEDALEQVSFEEGTLSFEFKKPSEHYGSSVERLQIYSLLKTMFQFPEVVEIKINNLEQESFNGHVDISEAFTREMLADL